MALSNTGAGPYMSYSLNEIEALSKRATRGAGLSWGIAEETGKATRWLASHDLPGVSLLVDVLRQNDAVARPDIAPQSLDGVWQATSGTLCPLVSGAALNDCAGRLSAGHSVEMANVSHPLLVVPFAAWAAIHIKAPVAVTWLDITIETDGFGLSVDDPKVQINQTSPVTLICTSALQKSNALSAPSHRGNANQAAWQALNAFALRTYAPATEESRILGAGAGTSDND